MFFRYLSLIGEVVFDGLGLPKEPPVVRRSFDVLFRKTFHIFLHRLKLLSIRMRENPARDHDKSGKEDDYDEEASQES
jgi:hypothetical protein